MSITATVEAGKIVLPPGTPWPSGTRVHIEAVAEGEAAVKGGKLLSPEEKSYLNGAGIVPDPRYGGFWDNLSAVELARRQGVTATADPQKLAWPHGPEDWEGFEEWLIQERRR